MAKLIDLTGKKFNKLTVIKKAEDYIQQPSGKHVTRWLCLCECGNEVIVRTNDLQSKSTQSCGCFKKEKASTVNKTHGSTHTRLYRTWIDMKSRCYNPNHKYFKDYGDRGITVCGEWLHSFESFYNWSLASGYKDSLTIDRVDVNGNYEAKNCRWVNMKIQARNKRSNRLVTINDETKCLAEWCETLNLNYRTVHKRLSRGWSPEQALELI